MEKKSLNKNLRKANASKKDEFYTQLADIENELKHYKDQFLGKVVFCNCDDPKESNFVKYFSRNFEYLGLKKLIATHYTDANLFTQESPYKLEYTGDKNGNRMPDPNEFITRMISNGDFRSEECIELLKEADIVVTNPPFSLFREYMAQLMEYKKTFLILGNQNALTYKEIFKLIRENKLWLGYDNGGTKWFQVPADYDIQTESRIKIENGIKYLSMGSIMWFTNLDTTKRHQELTFYKKYTSEEYLKYDNYAAINVNRVSDIPMDYDGIMGVPITFFDKYNPDQFEVIDGLNRYTVLDVAGLNENAVNNHLHMTEINGKSTYFRVLIKNKKVKK
ncbi:MAG TPA: adenine-specific methyltransferase EcoRI family protein [Candidatus Wunengus sp. YC61]|uniref:adenine-specific methyltransferase EcoRI family protein n=1 Tax=Candidatus Wunengus sp. YC61 TaxID=3367698 RepID=UPI004024EE43